VKYTQAELYYYFKKELSKKYNIFMGFDYTISHDVCFVIERAYENSILRVGERLSNFRFESIQDFLETHEERYDLKKLPELEKDSYELIQKLKILEQECIPRILIERNFKSKLKSL
jgi:hypothetical protein